MYIHMQQGQALDCVAFLQFPEGGSQDFVADTGVAELEAEFLTCEVFQVFLPQVVAPDQSLDCQRDASLLLSLGGKKRFL